MELKDKILQLRKKKRNTQAELAKALNVSPSTVSAWELGTNAPLMDKVTQMAIYFNEPISYFFDDVDMSSVNMVRLPVYGRISCGNGSLIFEEPETYEDVPLDWLNGGEYFLLVAKGDSMEGSRIFDNDKLLIRRQETVENGEIAAVVIGDECVLKRVNRQDDMLILESTNPKYPARIFNPEIHDNVKIVGKLRKLIVDF